MSVSGWPSISVHLIEKSTAAEKKFNKGTRGWAILKRESAESLRPKGMLTLFSY